MEYFIHQIIIFYSIYDEFDTFFIPLCGLPPYTLSPSPKGHGSLSRYVGWITPFKVVGTTVGFIAIDMPYNLTIFRLGMKTGADGFIQKLIPHFFALSLYFDIKTTCGVCEDCDRFKACQAVGIQVLPSPEHVFTILSVPET